MLYIIREAGFGDSVKVPWAFFEIKPSFQGSRVELFCFSSSKKPGILFVCPDVFLFGFLHCLIEIKSWISAVRMGRGMTIYGGWGCVLFSSKAWPDEFGWKAWMATWPAWLISGQFLLHKLLTIRTGGYSFNTLCYPGLYGRNGSEGKNPNNLNGSSF